MSFLKKLFGGASTETGPSFDAVDYKGFSICAEPIREGDVYRVAARIEKEIDGEVRTQKLVRADTVNSPDVAAEVSVTKAQQVIDERGDGVFDGPYA